MKPIAIASMGVFSALALSLVGCGDEPQPEGPGAPPMPALGDQIDRVGRPLVSTLLIAPFQPGEEARGQEKNSYNNDSNVRTWQDDWAGKIRDSIAIYDALDSEGEGNEFGCNNPLADLGTGEDTEVGRYQRFARIVADDRLYLNTGRAVCEGGGYFDVEQAVVTGGEIAEACGGRRPTEDVADVSYTVLVAGPQAPEVADGIEQDDGGEISASDDSFPFLGAPHPAQEDGDGSGQ